MSNNPGENSENRIVLGIDLGTTSIKVCIVQNGLILGTCSKETEASLECPSEQDVVRIIRTLEICVSSLPTDLLEKVEHIGVCGQMHGVCLWKYQQPLTTDINFNAYNCNQLLSNLYTWMDQKCDPQFLSSLPTPDSHLRLSTGHGCATLFWLNRNSPEAIENYDCAGTVMDFLVAILCNLSRPVMSVQNAASWGYFNSEKKIWNSDILLNSCFPTHLLPLISPADSKCAGKLSGPWLGIRAGTPIGPALGDLQCSVYSILLNKESAFINISTSAQIAYLSPTLPTDKTSQIEYFPYFQGQYLAVGASLNGGNVLQAFVGSIMRFGEELGIPLSKEFIWNKVLSAAESIPTTDLVVNPCLFGERHCPDERASVENICLDHLNLAHLTRGLCKGISANLNKFIDVTVLQGLGITKMTAGGSALLRNPILREELKKAYSSLDFNFTEADSALGAALFVSSSE